MQHKDLIRWKPLVLDTPASRNMKISVLYKLHDLWCPATGAQKRLRQWERMLSDIIGANTLRGHNEIT